MFLCKMQETKLTSYSHGAGCGCKIAPRLLDQILHSEFKFPQDHRLLVGYQTKDDAAVFDLGNGTGLISTTDFFMPIVDDPFTFGRIAATNAISDVYAMGGKPIMAIAILGWPIEKLAPEIAAKVIEGGRIACRDAGIMLAGGHSIDNQEPLFGLAVNGIVDIANLKQNSTATDNCDIYLTKPLGVGILATAQKKGLLEPAHMNIAINSMCELNTLGYHLAKFPEVKAITDVTGFGLLGHLLEVCEGSNVSGEINFAQVPIIQESLRYLAQGAIPGGTRRNYDSYGHKVNELNELRRNTLCDPQTSGGLLIFVEKGFDMSFVQSIHEKRIFHIGQTTNRDIQKANIVTVY